MSILKIIFIIILLSVIIAIGLTKKIESEFTFEISEPIDTYDELGQPIQVLWRHNVTAIKETNLLEILGWKK